MLCTHWSANKLSNSAMRCYPAHMSDFFFISFAAFIKMLKKIIM